MADEKNEAAQPAPKSNKVLIIVLLLVIVAGGGGAAFFLLGKGDKKAETSDDGNRVGPMLALKSFIINLDEPGSSRYLKLAIDLELRRPLTEMEARMTVRVHDKMIVFLSGLRVVDVQKRNAKLKLKRELVKLANQAYGGNRVKDVYFKEFVIQ